MADRSEITIDISDALASIEQLERQDKKRSPLMAVIADLVHDNVMENFAREEGSKGPWPELALSTKSEREKKGYGRDHPILVRSRQLQSSIVPFSSRDEAGASSNKIYGPIHNFGGPAGPGRKVTIPQREYMWLRSEYEEEITEEVDLHYMKDR